MRRLTGSEASGLAYLAENPQSNDRYQVINSLGVEARKVALVLIGEPDETVDESAIFCAEAIKKWAQRKNKLG